MELISVIVPIYNVAEYLSQCIESIQNQTYQNIEIILVDDGSSDSCPSICEYYAQMDQRIRVIHKANGGLSDARNTGIDAAQGQWLAFVDGDDYIAPTMLEKLYLAASEVQADMSVCGVEMFWNTENGRVANTTNMSVETSCLSGRDVLKLVEKTMIIPIVYVVAWNKLYRYELFSDLRYPLGRIHEDEFLAHHILGRCSSIACVKHPLYYYRQTLSSIMNRAYNINRLDVFLAYADRIQYYERNNLSEFSAPIQEYYLWQLLEKYFLFSETAENAEQLRACRDATKSILPYYFKRKDVTANMKISVFIFCYFPKLYKLLYKLIWHRNK